MYTNFGCDTTHFSFKECNNPSGLSRNLFSCKTEAIGIHCEGIKLYCLHYVIYCINIQIYVRMAMYDLSVALQSVE